MKPDQFVSALRELHLGSTFNPYSDRCKVHDVEDAPSRRSKALQGMLEVAAEAEVDAVWIGRDLGYRGGRRTGFALTDDVHLSLHAMRWNISVERATMGAVVAERTAAVVWSVLTCVTARVFLWNVFPLHPHEVDNPFTNRPHRPLERAAGEEILAELISMLRPRRLIAIGKEAIKSAQRCAGVEPVVQVRHPSYGGQRDFIQQVGCIYNLTVEVKQLELL